MITEDYVSFETAKLLKEKGFNEPCRKIYFTNGDLTDADASYLCEITNSCMPGFRQNGLCTSPTQQMVMKWLREVHKINLHLVPFYGFNGEYTDNCKWIYGIDFKNKGISLNFPKFNSYEEACESAIKYCLENLI